MKFVLSLIQIVIFYRVYYEITPFVKLLMYINFMKT